jgi:hypothetical protein
MNNVQNCDSYINYPSFSKPMFCVSNLVLNFIYGKHQCIPDMSNHEHHKIALSQLYPINTTEKKYIIFLSILVSFAAKAVLIFFSKHFWIS